MTDGSSIWDIVNAFAAVAAMLLSGYAVRHSQRVERRLSAEPYFRNKWRSIHRQYVESLKDLEGWIESYEQTVIFHNQEISLIPSLVLHIHAQIDWTYEPKTQLPFAQLFNVVEKLKAQVRNLDLLKYVTSQSRALQLQLRSIGASIDQDSEELQMFIHDLCLCCVAKTDATIYELTSSHTYHTLIKQETRAIAENVARLKVLLVTVERIVDQFGSRFDVS